MVTPVHPRRPLRERPLNKYIGPLHSSKVEALIDRQTNDHRLFHLPADVLQRSVFPCLSVNSLTALASTCHAAAAIVHEYRGPLPYLVRQDLSPLKIAYRNKWLGEYGVSKEIDDEPYSIRTLRFLVLTERHRIVQVEIRMGRELWSGCGKRGMDVTIHRQIKTRQRQASGVTTSRLEWQKLFESGDIDEAGNSYFSLQGFGHSYENLCWMDIDEQDNEACPPSIVYDQMNPAVEDLFRDVLDYFWVCARRIAASPSLYRFPTLDFIVFCCVPEPLYRFLSPEFEKWSGPCEPEDPYPLPYEWLYCPPPTYAEWFSFFDSTYMAHTRFGYEKYGEWRSYEIHEIPWNRKWYPKPVVLNKSNLIGSLPVSILRESLVHYLSNADVLAVAQACPKVMTRMINHFRGE